MINIESSVHLILSVVIIIFDVKIIDFTFPCAEYFVLCYYFIDVSIWGDIDKYQGMNSFRWKQKLSNGARHIRLNLIFNLKFWNYFDRILKLHNTHNFINIKFFKKNYHSSLRIRLSLLFNSLEPWGEDRRLTVDSR